MKHYYLSGCQKLTALLKKYESISTTKKVIHLNETDFLQLIDYYKTEDAIEKALQIASDAITKYNASVPLYTRQAKLLIISRLEKLALESLQIAEQHAPDSVEIDLLKIEAYASLREYKKALQGLSTIKQKYFMSREELSNIYFQEAFVFEKLELFGKMFHSLKKAIKQNPKNKEALERMWVSVELSRKHQESVAFHTALINDAPYSAQIWYNLGHAYYSLFKYEKAIDAFEYAYIIDPKFELAYRDCADVCMLTKKHQKALNCLEEMSEHFEADQDMLITQGKCYHYLNNISKAKTTFYKALGMPPKSDEVYYHIGECYASEFNWHSAVYFFSQAYKIAPERDDYCSALAFAYYQDNQYNKALPLFYTATKLAPSESTYWTQLACYYMDNGNADRALQILDNAEPHTYGADLLYTRAIALLIKGKRKKAFQFLDEALVEDYEMHDIIFDFLPTLREDPNIKAILKFYAP